MFYISTCHICDPAALSETTIFSYEKVFISNGLFDRLKGVAKERNSEKTSE